METVAVVGVAVGALLVGALLPLLIEARATLRSARRLIETATPKVMATLDEAREAAAHVNSIADSLEPAGPRVAEIAEAAAGLTGAIHRLRSGLELAATVGPAVSAAVKAFYAARAAMPGGSDDDAEPPETERSPEGPRQDHSSRHDQTPRA